MQKISNRLSFVLAAAFLFSFSSGCGLKSKKLNERIETYNKAIKWGGVQAMSPFVLEEDKPIIIEKKIKQMNDKNIVEYGVTSLSLNDDGKTATAIVQYSVIDQRTQSLIGISELQLWKRSGGKWYLTKIVSSDEKEVNPSNFQ